MKKEINLAGGGIREAADVCLYLVTYGNSEQNYGQGRSNVRRKYESFGPHQPNLHIFGTKI